MKSKVIIIGSGIGGLCCGIRLLKKGFDVEIFEKQNNAGGVTRHYKSKDVDLNFDMTASIAIDPLEYQSVFNDAGLNPNDYFEMLPLDVIYKIFFENGKRYCLYKDIKKQNNHFQDLFNEPIEHYISFVNNLYKNYEVADKAFLSRSFLNLKDILSIYTLKNAFSIKPFSSVSSLVSNYIKNEDFKKVLLFQSFYMGISPYKLVNVYATVPAVAQKRGIMHIKGGFSAYSAGLLKAFLDLGGKINYNSQVDRIIVSNKIACGIICGGEYKICDIVISNADFCYTLSKLLKSQKIFNRYNPMTSSNFQMSCSVFILRLGLSKKLDTLNVHNLYINNNFKEEINNIFKGKIPENPPLYIYYPSIIDDSFVKNNKTSLNIMVRVPNLSFDDIHWDEKNIMTLRNICVRTLSEITGLKKIEEYIIYEDYLTPKDLKNQYNCYEGAAFGIGHTTSQSIVFRPQVAIPSIKNLYFVGSSTHPGNGVTIVMKGAKLVAEEITKKIT